MNWAFPLFAGRIKLGIVFAACTGACACAASPVGEQSHARQSAAEVPVFKSFKEMVATPDPNLLEAVALTRGPRYHWFSF